jgi:WD40 repeat protein
MAIMSNAKKIAWLGVLCLETALWAAAFPKPACAEEAKPREKTTYADHVRPIFREHCVACHNQAKAQNDLALDSYEKLMAGGASGKVIEPGNPDNSYLWGLVIHKEEPHMPPKQDKLPEAKLAVIRRWIEGGALKDSGSKAAATGKPGLDLAVSGGAKRPAGPPILPQGLSRQPVVYTPRAAATTTVASSPWAPLVAVAGQQQIVLYHSDTAELLGILPFPEGIPQALRFSRSGSLLLAGGGRHAARGLAVVYDVKTGRRMFDVGDELDTVLAADINDTHTKIALGGPQRVVRVFSTKDGTLVYEVRKHNDWIYAAQFSPDGVLLATADRGGGLMIWEAETGRDYLSLDGHKEAVTGVSWRDDSNLLASASEDGTIRLWEMQNGRQLKSINAHPGGAASVEFTHDGRLVSAGRDKLVKVWDANGNLVRAFPPFSEPALRATFTHDGARVVAGDWSGETRMWNTADGALVASLPANPPTLEMAFKAAQEKADAARAELAQADAVLGQRKAALGQAVGQAAQKADEAKAAAAAAEAAKKTAQAAKENKEALQKAAEATETTARHAADQATAAKAAADKLAAETAEIEKHRNAKAAIADAAAKAAIDARTAAERAAAEKAAFEKGQKKT